MKKIIENLWHDTWQIIDIRIQTAMTSIEEWQGEQIASFTTTKNTAKKESKKKRKKNTETVVLVDEN